MLPIALLGGVLFLPFLGAVGLWDPWETHYAEVAREMLERRDFVFPHWESAPFFSKPPLLMWLDALGMALAGTNRSAGPVALVTEWGVRLPSALASIAALCLLAFALTRTVGRRAALTACFALATMPLYALLSRQAITDTPFEAALVAAMACAIMGLFDPRVKPRPWWYAFYALCGLATLAKELLGLVLPVGVLAVYLLLCWMPGSKQGVHEHVRWLLSGSYRACVRAGSAPMPGVWAQLARIQPGRGLLVFSLVALPWLLAMVFFAKGRDPENETFVYRYFIHDQFARLTTGVHTTERDTPFTYFLQEGGYALFPWVAVLPAAFICAGRARVRGGDVKAHVSWIAVLWALVAFGLVSASATKFPHYIFPALPALAILIGLFVDSLWEEGLQRHALGLLLGLVFFALVARDLAAVPAADGRTYMGVPVLEGGLKHLTDLFTYNHDRPYPLELILHPLGWGSSAKSWTLRDVVALAFVGAGALFAGLALADARQALVRAFGVFAFAWALWLGWSHWVALSPHWTQRDLFWRYYAHRQPGEPIGAFDMNWKGETFYSRNAVRQLNDGTLAAYVNTPGRKWLLVEHGQRLRLVEQLAAGHPIHAFDPGVNDKFVLLSID